MEKGLFENILAFLRELDANNNRDWFAVHKENYLNLKNDFDVFIGGLIERIADFDEDIRGLEVKDCVYRIYRDVRFSPDKRPYKTHFAAYMAKRGGRRSPYGGYYLHIQPDNSMLSGGIYCPEPAVLKRLRQDVYDNAEEFQSIIENPDFKKEFQELDNTNSLKTVPAPFPKDSPLGDLVKHKDYTVLSLKPDSFFLSKDVEEKMVKVFRLLYPFNRFLNYTIDEMN